MANQVAGEVELDAGQKIVELNTNVLAQYGITFGKTARILDFGCGSGRHTYEYLDAGYENVAGFDVKNYVDLRNEPDRERFRFLNEEGSYRIPYEDNHFDLVVSTSVFEHVVNQQETISEIARILKPGGATLHVFPSRWRPIEPHIFVPFGGALQSMGWLRFWAMMGVRNRFQENFSSADTAARNLSYCKTGIAYPRFQEIDAMWQRRFERVDYAERAFLEATRGISRISRLVSPITSMIPGSLNLYRFAHTRAVLARLPLAAN